MNQPEDPLEAAERFFGPDDCAKILRCSVQMTEAYVAWAFSTRTSLHLKSLEDEVQKHFKNYLELAHPDLYTRLRLAEKRGNSPILVVDGLSD